MMMMMMMMVMMMMMMMMMIAECKRVCTNPCYVVAGVGIGVGCCWLLVVGCCWLLVVVGVGVVVLPLVEQTSVHFVNTNQYSD